MSNSGLFVEPPFIGTFLWWGHDSSKFYTSHRKYQEGSFRRHKHHSIFLSPKNYLSALRSEIQRLMISNIEARVLNSASSIAHFNKQFYLVTFKQSFPLQIQMKRLLLFIHKIHSCPNNFVNASRQLQKNESSNLQNHFQNTSHVVVNLRKNKFYKFKLIQLYRLSRNSLDERMQPFGNGAIISSFIQYL